MSTRNASVFQVEKANIKSVVKMTDLGFKGKCVLIRSDLNVPVKDGKEEPLVSSNFITPHALLFTKLL